MVMPARGQKASSRPGAQSSGLFAESPGPFAARDPNASASRRLFGAYRRDNELSEIASSLAGQEIATVATYITTARYTANRGSQAAATSGS